MNIIHIDQFKARTELDRDEALGLLNQCRSMAADRLKRALTAMMAKVDDKLYELSEKDKDAQSAYFQAMRDLRLKRSDIELGFQREFAKGFDAALKELGVEVRNPQGDAGLELSLMDEQDLEEDIAIQDMISKLEMVAGVELDALNQRMAVLAAIESVENEKNPLGPAVICGAFQQACKPLDVDLSVKLVMFKLFDRYVVSAAAETIYAEINRLLVDNQVLPVLPGRGRNGEGGADSETDDLFSQLEKLIVGDQALSQGAAFAPPQQHFMSALQALQQGKVDTSSAFSGVLDPQALASGMVNVLHQIRTSQASQGLSQPDSMTIDVIAMLFDYILEDKAIPDAMKALIGRLQIPMLKVALRDKRFISKRKHPARRLLNLLAEAAIGWDETLGKEDAVYLKVDGVVQYILDDYDEDAAMFEPLVEDFEQFLRAEQEVARQRADAAARMAESRERLQTAKGRVQTEIDQRLYQGGVPEAVQRFVNTHWRSLLLVTYVKEGEGSYSWKRALVTMDNLIWSVTPKTSQERSRLVKILPNLLQVLREGMQLISMRTEERDHFLAQLAGCHARVVNAGSSTASSLQEQGAVYDYLKHPNASAPIPPQPEPEIEADAVNATSATLQQLVEEGVIEAEEVELAGEPDQFDELDDSIDMTDLKTEYLDSVAKLKQGTWLELPDSQGNAIRAKLTWVSPVTGKYLFTDRKGLKACEKTLHALAADFQCGNASVIEEGSLMDRAAGRMLDGLQQAAGQ